MMENNKNKKEANNFSFVNLTTKEINEIIDIPYRDNKRGLYERFMSYFKIKPRVYKKR